MKRRRRKKNEKEEVGVEGNKRAVWAFYLFKSSCCW